MSGLVGTYGNIVGGEFVIACSDGDYEGFVEPGWWRSYLLCANEGSDSVTLRSPDGAHGITVAREGYVALGTPKHHVGEKVRAKKSGKGATVVAVDWHEGREAFYYTLDYGDRISTNWFFDDDVEAI